MLYMLSIAFIASSLQSNGFFKSISESEDDALLIRPRTIRQESTPEEKARAIAAIRRISRSLSPQNKPVRPKTVSPPTRPLPTPPVPSRVSRPIQRTITPPAIPSKVGRRKQIKRIKAPTKPIPMQRTIAPTAERAPQPFALPASAKKRLAARRKEMTLKAERENNGPAKRLTVVKKRNILKPVAPKPIKTKYYDSYDY